MTAVGPFRAVARIRGGLAMGGQSVAAPRFGAATTCLTGALTALRDLVRGRAVPLVPVLAVAIAGVLAKRR
ncbi:hypothetical protein [Amycolatopsis alkalitolerans]|uniref:Uncharacterized protein n=1 Tax=Amycolatopsis alkalitolerans TaxID=2547244 RepID=A0A5C4MDP3_9PSEU|nr:hypothetical protein [Amycolatopsis alkalitolerans]TNC29673.1 hypothetical protein FG385_01575 [Amycolatopsis alkalitolerans]